MDFGQSRRLPPPGGAQAPADERRERDAVRRPTASSERSRSALRATATAASEPANDAAIPAANPRAVPAGSPRRRTPRPFSPAAPAMTGSAAWRESTAASARAKPRARAAASVAPLRETPGMQRARLREAERERVEVASRRSRRRAARAGASAGAIASAPATSPAAIVAGRAEPPLDRVARARSRRSPAAASSGRASARGGGRAARSLGRPRRAGRRAAPRGAGVQRDLEGLAQLGVEVGVGPAAAATARASTCAEEEIGSSSAGPCSSAERERVACAQPAASAPGGIGGRLAGPGRRGVVAAAAPRRSARRGSTTPTTIIAATA